MSLLLNAQFTYIFALNIWTSRYMFILLSSQSVLHIVIKIVWFCLVLETCYINSFCKEINENKPNWLALIG